jgi:alpha-N-arabinofuranosidase
MNFRLVILSTVLIAITIRDSALEAQTPATLNLELSHPKAAVSPTLYGLMTEEINYSYDGGLYAELVRNRTFRSDWSGILNWFLIEKGQASARLGRDQKEGPSAGP